MAPEPDTWDQKLGRLIRGFWKLLMLPMGAGQDPTWDWERAKKEAWDREDEAARTRSSEELHEELGHLDSSS